MTIPYVLMDPSGNQTILVTAPVPAQRQPAVASALMAREPGAEQVGFLSPGRGCDLTLRMAGGEFCGNASMSAAAYLCHRDGRLAAELQLQVFGAADPVAVSVAAEPGGLWRGTVAMPRPTGVALRALPGGETLPVVTFPGIVHVILETPLEPQTAESLAVEWCRALDAPALGLLQWDRAAGLLTPLVYVPAAGTLVWERACGSGSCAVGAWLAQERGAPVKLTLRQPGGALTVSAQPDGPLFLRGTVRLMKADTAEL